MTNNSNSKALLSEKKQSGMKSPKFSSIAFIRQVARAYKPVPNNTGGIILN